MNGSDCDREAIYASALDAFPGMGDDSLADGQEDPQIDRFLDEQALMLHRQGRTYRDIASLLTISVGGAWKRVQRQQAKLEAVDPGDRAEMRNECLLALRMAVASVSEEAADGEPAARVVLNQLANTILRFWKQEDAQKCLPKRAARNRLAASVAEETALQLPASEPQQLGVCNREQDREQTVNTELQSEVEQEVECEQMAVARREPQSVEAACATEHSPAMSMQRFAAAMVCALWLAVAALLNGPTLARESVEPVQLANAALSQPRINMARNSWNQEVDPHMTQIYTDFAGAKRLFSTSVHLGAICGSFLDDLNSARVARILAGSMQVTDYLH